MNNKVDLGQVFTKHSVAERMVDQFTLPPKSSILDPCFGNGIFLDILCNSTDYKITGVELDEILYKKYKNKHPDYNLIEDNFFNLSNSQKYDGIIMNPPYIRHEKINDLEKYGVSKHLLKKDPIFNVLPSVANIYMYFIIKALKLLRPDGELIVIFPNTWIKSQSGISFRDFLYSTYEVKLIETIPNDAFEKNALVEVVILKIYNRMPNANQKLNVRLKPCFDPFEDSGVKLETISKIRRGITTGYNSFFINPAIKGTILEDHLDEIVSSPKNLKGYSADNAELDKILVIDNLDDDTIRNYVHFVEKKIKTTHTPKTIYQTMKKNKIWYKLKLPDCRGILFGYIIRKNARFILNNHDYLVRDNFYIIRPNDGEINLLFSLLNNYYVYAQLEDFGKRYGNGLLKLQKYDMSILKIVSPILLSKGNQEELIEAGKQLIDSGNEIYISKITKILSQYSSISAEDVRQTYENMKAERLVR